MGMHKEKISELLNSSILFFWNEKTKQKQNKKINIYMLYRKPVRTITLILDGCYSRDLERKRCMV